MVLFYYIKKYSTLHMASVTKVKTRGVCALVGTVLQVNDALTAAKLLFREVALVLFSWLWSQERAGPFWVHVALSRGKRNKVEIREKLMEIVTCKKLTVRPRAIMH